MPCATGPRPLPSPRSGPSTPGVRVNASRCPFLLAAVLRRADQRLAGAVGRGCGWCRRRGGQRGAQPPAGPFGRGPGLGSSRCRSTRPPTRRQRRLRAVHGALPLPAPRQVSSSSLCQLRQVGRALSPTSWPPGRQRALAPGALPTLWIAGAM